MAKIKGPGEAGPTTAPEPTASAGAAGPTDVGYVEKANALESLLQSDEVVRFFTDAARRLASGELTSREQAVHVAVDAVLAETLPMFTPEMRAKLVPQVSEAMMAEPAMAANFDLLLGTQN